MRCLPNRGAVAAFAAAMAAAPSTPRRCLLSREDAAALRSDLAVCAQDVHARTGMDVGIDVALSDSFLGRLFGVDVFVADGASLSFE